MGEKLDFLSKNDTDQPFLHKKLKFSKLAIAMVISEDTKICMLVDLD